MVADSSEGEEVIAVVVLDVLVKYIRFCFYRQGVLIYACLVMDFLTLTVEFWPYWCPGIHCSFYLCETCMVAGDKVWSIVAFWKKFLIL